MYNGYDLVVYDTNIVIDIFDKSKSKNRISKKERKGLYKITQELFKQEMVYIAPLNRAEYSNLSKNKINLSEIDLGHISKKQKDKYISTLTQFYKKKRGVDPLQTDDIIDIMTIASLIVYVKQNDIKVIYVTHDKILNDPEVYDYVYDETGGLLEIHNIDTFISLYRSLIN